MLRTAARDIFKNISEIGGVGFTAEVDTIVGRIGILVTDAPGENNHIVAAGVLMGLELSAELATEVANLNRYHRLGGLTLVPDIMGEWRLVASCRVDRAWLDPAEPASRRMAHDILRMLPRQVYFAVWYLTREKGIAGEPWTLNDKWWIDLVSHM